MRVVSYEGGLSSGWSYIRMVSHQSGLSSEQSRIRVVYHQDGLIRAVSHCGLSTGWSLIRVVFFLIFFYLFYRGSILQGKNKQIQHINTQHRTLSHLSIYVCQLPPQHHTAHSTAHLMPSERRPLGFGVSHGLWNGPATLNVHLHIGVRLVREVEDAPWVGVQSSFDVLVTGNRF